MPTTLTDSSSFDAMTAPIGTDIRNAASVRTCLQAAANRDRFVYDIVTPLADIASLKAISAPADGTVRSVIGHGAYVFLSSYVGAETMPWVVAPDVGSGRWVSMAANLSGYEGGIEKHHAPLEDIAALKAVTGQVSGDTRLVRWKGTYAFNASDTTPERLPLVVAPSVGLGRWSLAMDTSYFRTSSTSVASFTSTSTSSTTYTNSAGYNIPTPTFGDRYLIDAWFRASSAGGYGGVYVVTSSGTTILDEQYLSATTDTRVSFAAYEVLELGYTSIRMGVRSDDGTESATMWAGGLRLQGLTL